MARLKDSVSPKEVLETIRGGALKNEVIKKYKTSEQELARLLLPLYRAGDLSKEEFNDFFKGVPLRPKNAPQGPKEQPPSTLTPKDEPPSAIVRSLSAMPERDAAGDLPHETDKAVEGQEVIPKKAVAPTPEPQVPEPVVEEEPTLETKPIEEPVVTAAAESEPLQEPVKKPAASVSDISLDSAGMSSVIEALFAKLTSIDNRLSAIEKKLDHIG